MKFLISFLFIALTQIAYTQNSTSLDIDLERIKGTWIIDLKTTPDGTPYLKEFVIRPDEGNQFRGVFYGSNFKDGYFNLNWEVVYFGFSSKDGSNSYYHSGYFKDGKVYGVTYCPDREFTMPWLGERKK